MDTNQIDIATLSTADLKRLQAVAEQTIESRRADEQSAAMNQIKTLVEENEIDVDSLMNFLNPKPAGAKRGRKPGSTNGAPKETTSKAPPKFRDPVSGATWTGKGRKPEWIKAASNPDAFLIPEAERTSPPAPKATRTPKVETQAQSTPTQAEAQPPAEATAPDTTPV